MSSPFNYEIDEKNIRVKLKEMQIPYKEDAWIQFETYSDSCKNVYKPGVLPSFNLNINRNIVLPLIFGGIIILFSMLLFKFVNIKGNETAEKISKPEPTIAKPEPEKTIKPLVVDTAKAIETEKRDTIANVTTTSLAVITPSVQNTTVTAVPEKTIAVKTPTIQNTPTVSVQNIALVGTWMSLADGLIYESPNIASKIIGHSVKNQNYQPIEETNYFIKIAFNQNGSFGYLLKSQCQKNYGQNTGTSNSSANVNSNGKRKKRKAEAMESIAAPSLLPTSGGEDKEPELK